jgi:CO/xanthine dehydrogenase Mo-binding subunit
MTDAVMDIVGGRLPRREIREKVTGRARYIADMAIPGMLHGAILTSPYAHARILGYETSAARRLPGVHCVLTGDDFAPHRMGAFIKDETAIAIGKARYVGEAVAAVAADDEETARRALGLIQVDYEELPAVLTPEAALGPGASLVHEDLDSYFKVFDAQCGGNLMSRTEIIEGDVERGFAECDVIAEGRFTTQAQYHLSLEPVGALADVDEQGRVTLWSANQSVFRVQANVCESLGLPMSRLRSMTPRIGGGFGNKMEAHVQPLTVALALAAGRPVRIILSREEDFAMVRARHPFEIRIRTGAKRDGTLWAREVEVLLDGGAYGDDSPGVLGHALLCARGPYRIPHTKAGGRVAYTNKLRFGAFRGFGHPQVNFAGEAQLDELAAKLGLDPFEIRLKNAMRPGDTWFGGQTVPSNGLVECLERVREAASVGTAAPGRRRGLGVAACGHISGLLATGAIVRLLEDGTVVLNTGAVDIGQGSDTVLSQMCAEALKVPLDRVALASPDTDGSPYNWGTTASRVTYTTGRSVVAACAEVERRIKEHAAEMMECDAADLELRPGGLVGIKGVPGKALPYLAVSAHAHWRQGGPIVGADSMVYGEKTIDPKRAAAFGLPFGQIGVYSFCALATEVEVDETTGKAEVVRAWEAVDVGRAINPALVEGQVEGGIVQGIGYALTEEMVWDGPRLANPSLMDYKAPGARDAPREIHSIIVEDPQPEGPFGAKGVGEIVLVPAPAAVAGAIEDAVGVRLRDLPMTPERVLRAMLEKEASGAA